MLSGVSEISIVFLLPNELKKLLVSFPKKVKNQIIEEIQQIYSNHTKFVVDKAVRVNFL